jgi:hypothetical protein
MVGAADVAAEGVAAEGAADTEEGAGAGAAVAGADAAGVALEAGAAVEWDVSFPPPQESRVRAAKSRGSVLRFKEVSCGLVGSERHDLSTCESSPDLSVRKEVPAGIWNLAEIVFVQGCYIPFTFGTFEGIIDWMQL